MTVLIKITNNETLFEKVRSHNSNQQLYEYKIDNQPYFLISPILAKALRKVGVEFDTYHTDRELHPGYRKPKNIIVKKQKATPILKREHMSEYIRTLSEVKFVLSNF